MDKEVKPVVVPLYNECFPQINFEGEVCTEINLIARAVDRANRLGLAIPNAVNNYDKSSCNNDKTVYCLVMPEEAVTMTHLAIYEQFKKIFPMYVKSKNEWFPNGKNAIRISLGDGMDFVFTFKNNRNFNFETIDSFISRTFPKTQIKPKKGEGNE